MIDRKLKKTVEEKLSSGKVIIILGARQVGKSTLLKQLFLNKEEVLWLNGDEVDVQNIFTEMSSTRFKAIFGKNKIIVIDEAQRIANVGLRLKLISDSLPEYQLVVNGSSAFELTNKVNEPLTGRKWEYTMFPLSFAEMVEHHGLLEEKRLVPHRLVYGYYPEIVTQQGSEIAILKQLSDSYLFKDILMLEQLKKTDRLVKLLQALAFQVGSQVSYTELGQLCGLDNKTVEKYITLLEQSYVIFRMSSFSRNLRNELKFSKKIFFFDNGIRNALISNFAQVENRTDTGALWENFLISERMKRNHYTMQWANYWFWRTKQQLEIDYIEEQNGQLSAYEFKWNPNAKYRQPKAFSEAYPEANFKIIHKENIEDFLL
jgi:hypothetical protein